MPFWKSVNLILVKINGFPDEFYIDTTQIKKGPVFYDQDPFTRTLYENEKINSLLIT